MRKEFEKTIKEFDKNDIIGIRWQDTGAFEQGSWSSEEDISQSSCIMDTVGFFISYDDGWIITASSYDEDNENYGGITRIHIMGVLKIEENV